MSIHLHKQSFFNPKFYQEARKLRQNGKYDKTPNNANNTILLASLPLFLFGIHK